MNGPASQQEPARGPDQECPFEPSGNGDGIDTLLPAVYDELHAVAAAVLHRNGPFDPTRTTSLINDVYVRLANRGLQFRNQGHFLCVAAKAMRLVLLDRARRRLSAKRGGHEVIQPLDSQIALVTNEDEVLSIDAALTKLAALDERKSRIIELRFFGGLSVEDTAAALEISPATVKREWTLARAWLYLEVGGDGHARENCRGQ